MAQQQQTFYSQPQPASAPPIQNATAPYLYQQEPYPRAAVNRAVKILSIIQIVLGGTCISFQIIANIVAPDSIIINQEVSAGTWNGIYFVVTGVVGVVSAIRKSRQLVVATTVMNVILAALFAPILLICSSMGLVQPEYEHEYEYDWSTSDTLLALTTADVIMLVSSIVNFVLGICLSVVGCLHSCCNCGPNYVQVVEVTGQSFYHQGVMPQGDVNKAPGVEYYQQSAGGSGVSSNTQAYGATQAGPSYDSTHQTAGVLPPPYPGELNFNFFYNSHIKKP